MPEGQIRSPLKKSSKFLHAQPKRKLTSAQREAKRRRKAKTMIVFINGKQKRIRREPTVEGLPVDEFIRRNADPIWLHQAGDWEEIRDQA